VKLLTIVLLLVLFILVDGNRRIGHPANNAQTQTTVGSDRKDLQSNSLCAKDEQNVFSCVLKRSPKIVSLCAAQTLGSDRGYLQYRFGLPGKLELEYPKLREGTQQLFRYMHYFRAQVDMTEITFNVDGNEYSVFDDYNGEEIPKISQHGVTVKARGSSKQVTLLCSGKKEMNLSILQSVLPEDNR